MTLTIIENNYSNHYLPLLTPILPLLTTINDYIIILTIIICHELFTPFSSAFLDKKRSDDARGTRQSGALAAMAEMVVNDS